jgi:hypothetical protein
MGGEGGGVGGMGGYMPYRGEGGSMSMREGRFWDGLLLALVDW